jgi:hypothetical protein
VIQSRKQDKIRYIRVEFNFWNLELGQERNL